MTSFMNTALFIKRAEEYQTKEFIINAFETNKIGKVKDVTLIKKQNDFGKSYNGVIVIFERWNMNNLVEKLLNEMASSPDGTTKFYFNEHRFWHINIHKQKMVECEETMLVDPSLSDKEKIAKLEELVKSMSAQIHYMQTRQEKAEQQLMMAEHKHTEQHLLNMELHTQLQEKQWEQEWFESDVKLENDELIEENQTLKYRLGLLGMDLAQKDNEIKSIRESHEKEKCVYEQELRDRDCVIDYLTCRLTKNNK